MKLLVIITLISLGLITFPHSALALDSKQSTSSPLVYILDGTALSGYSDVAGPTEGDFSINTTWLGSVGWNISDQTQAILAYNGSFQQSQLFIAQDEGAKESNQVMSNNLSAALKYAVNDNFVFEPNLFFDVIYVKETADEQLGRGLYDYEDKGAGFENTHVFDSQTDQIKFLTYGLTVFHRQYPHYSSLISQFSDSTLEQNEKDFYGYKLDTSYKTKLNQKLTGTLDGTFIFKDYTDKLNVSSDGIREEDKREDFYFEITGDLLQEINDSWSLGFGTGFTQNISSLDYYDTRNTTSLTDDRFFGGYYDYFKYFVSPSLLFKPQINTDKNMNPLLQLSYTFDRTFYTGRNALDQFDTIKSEDQLDQSHTIFAQSTWPITSQLNWITSGSWKKQTSNNDFEQSYQYSYEVWSVLSGVSFEL